MAIQQGAGYRDPAKTMTIKALQERQKLAQAATAKAVEMPQQISDPWQAAAHVMGVGASRFADLSAGRQEADARARLSQIMAGIDPEKGASMQQIAEMQQLDPELANKEYERMMTAREAARRQEDEQQFQTGERVGGQEFTAAQQEDTQAATAEQNDLNRQADVARQKMSDAAAAGRQDDQQAASQELARINAQIDATKTKTADQAKIDAIGQGVAAREAEWLRLNPNGDKNSPEAQAYILREAAPATGGLTSPTALKDINEFKLQGTQIDSTLNTLNHAEELINRGTVIGGDAAMWLLNAAGSVPGGITGLKAAAAIAGYPLTDQQIADTMEFDSIMGLGATEHMANTLKGQSSNLEMTTFRRDMANRNAPESVRRNAVQRMKSALLSDRGALDSTLQSFQQPALNPYEYKSSTVVAPDQTGGTGTGAGAGAGGGTDANADISKMSAEERAAERKRLQGQ